MPKRVLLITDMAGQTKVAMTAMIPILSHMGYSLFNLPTALVSNNFAYGDYALLDTTEYMRKSISVWQKLDFRFDAVGTGIVISHEQLEIVNEYCKFLKTKGITIFSDPVMADNGELYNGISESIISYMRELIGVADYIVPNYTEACFLAGIPYQSGSISSDEMRKLIDSLRKNTSGTIVITSAFVDNKKQVCCYDPKSDEYFNLPYDEIPVSFSGTGDIFCSVFMGHILKGEPVRQSIEIAMTAVGKMVDRFKTKEDKLEGLPVESCLDLL